VNAAVLGGTKGIGRALSRLLVEKGHGVALLGRDLDDVKRSAEDLRHRAGSGIDVPAIRCDLERPDTFAAALDEAFEKLPGLDTVIVTAAAFAAQHELESDRGLSAKLLSVNFTNTVLFCEEARERLLRRGGGRLVVFSSVAGERARKPVVLYGAAKAGLSAYLEGLDHKFRDKGLVTICVKPGFVKTGMTQGLDPPPFAGEPSQVAEDVLRAIEKGNPVVYTPAIWRLVMFAIRMLPRFAMRRISF
jgi:NAD(P)-dependent dehydrogenase (short-subunit alcohol dehydrogenase family)